MKWLAALVLVAGQALAGELVVSGGSAAADTARFGSGDIAAAVGEVSLLLDERHWDISAGVIGRQYDGGVGSFGYLSAQRIMRLGELLPLDLFLGGGLIVRTDAENVTSLLPSAVSFSLSAGWDIGPVRLQYRHASNGGLKDPNRGENWILVGWIF